MDLSPEQVKRFNEDGFIVIPGVMSTNTLERARAGFWRMLEKCRSGEYRRVRSSIFYPDDILGIENIFRREIFEPDVFAALQESRVLERSTQLLGEENVYVQLNRLICTVGRSFNGSWHRDLGVGKNYHIQSTVAFYPECGVFVIRGSHVRPDSSLGLTEGDYMRCRSSLPGEERVQVPAGGLMLFHSAILHRGTCAGHGKFIRAHVHMRIARARAAGELSRSNLEDFTNPGLLAAASAPWRRALTLDLPAPVKWASTPEPVTDRSARGTLRRLVHGLAYRSTPLVGPLLPKDYAYRKLYVPPEDVSFYDGVTSP